MHYRIECRVLIGDSILPNVRPFKRTFYSHQDDEFKRFCKACEQSQLQLDIKVVHMEYATTYLETKKLTEKYEA